MDQPYGWMGTEETKEVGSSSAIVVSPNGGTQPTLFRGHGNWFS